MKNIILVSGVAFILIYTFVCLVTGNSFTNMLFGDFSIALTTTLLFLTYTVPIQDGYKIGYTFIFSITGLIRLICASLSITNIQGNYALIIFVIIFCLEFILLYISYAIREK
jgi:hypothetical protein